MPSIKRGANLLFTRNLLASDGVTPLAYSSLASVVLRLEQNGNVLAELTPGSGALRVGGDNTSLILELTSAFTGSCEVGTLEEHWTLKKSNADFTSEPTYEVHRLSYTDLTITA